MSTKAIAICLDAHVDPLAYRVLLILADYADTRGRGAGPSVSTIIERTHLSRATVYRAIAGMVKAGLITRGDQAAVAYLPKNRRPVVYDLHLGAIHRTSQGSLTETPDGRILGSPGVSVGSLPGVSRGLTVETQIQEQTLKETARARQDLPVAETLRHLDIETGRALVLCPLCMLRVGLDEHGLIALHTDRDRQRCPAAGHPPPPDRVIRTPPGDPHRGAAAARTEIRKARDQKAG